MDRLKTMCGKLALVLAMALATAGFATAGGINDTIHGTTLEHDIGGSALLAASQEAAKATVVFSGIVAQMEDRTRTASGEMGDTMAVADIGQPETATGERIWPSCSSETVQKYIKEYGLDCEDTRAGYVIWKDPAGIAGADPDAQMG